jgi:hypothetical protein
MRYFILCFTLLFNTLVLADDDHRFIQVSGNGSIRAMPDYLQLNLSIEATAKDLKAAKETVDNAMKSLLQITTSLNIAEADIDAAQIRNHPQYEWRNNNREYRGEQVNRSVTITLRNKESYTDLSHQLLNISAVRIHGSQLKFNDRQALQNQAFANAVEAARKKAAIMAKASDNALGNVLSIQEQGAHAPQPVYAMARMEKMSMDSEPAPMLIQEQTIDAAVVIRYELK